MSDYQTIALTIDNSIATLTLNQPDTLNSVTSEMYAELCDALALIKVSSTARCLILIGTGRGFCSGQKLKDLHRELTQGTLDVRAKMGEMYNPLVQAIVALPIPTVCAVNGVAAGAGANIPMACDIVLAARNASFANTFARIGLIPGAGGTWFLPKAIGLPRALATALLSEPISAEQAEQWGLIWRCVDDECLMEEAMTLAQRLVAQPAKSLALIKQAMRASYNNDLYEQLELEKELQWQASQTKDFAEAISVFAQKRPAGRPNRKEKKR